MPRTEAAREVSVFKWTLHTKVWIASTGLMSNPSVVVGVNVGSFRVPRPCPRTPGFVAWQVALGPVVALVPARGREREYARRQTHDCPCVVQKQGQMSWTTLQESQLLVSSIETSHYLLQLGAQTAAQLFRKILSSNVENAPAAPTHLLKAH